MTFKYGNIGDETWEEELAEQSVHLVLRYKPEAPDMAAHHLKQEFFGLSALVYTFRYFIYYTYIPDKLVTCNIV
jgi:hypothetical protein